MAVALVVFDLYYRSLPRFFFIFFTLSYFHLFSLHSDISFSFLLFFSSLSLFYIQIPLRPLHQSLLRLLLFHVCSHIAPYNISLVPIMLNSIQTCPCTMMSYGPNALFSCSPWPAEQEIKQKKSVGPTCNWSWKCISSPFSIFTRKPRRKGKSLDKEDDLQHSIKQQQHISWSHLPTLFRISHSLHSLAISFYSTIDHPLGNK